MAVNMKDYLVSLVNGVLVIALTDGDGHRFPASPGCKAGQTDLVAMRAAMLNRSTNRSATNKLPKVKATYATTAERRVAIATREGEFSSNVTNKQQACTLLHETIGTLGAMNVTEGELLSFIRGRLDNGEGSIKPLSGVKLDIQRLALAIARDTFNEGKSSKGKGGGFNVELRTTYTYKGENIAPIVPAAVATVKRRQQ